MRRIVATMAPLSAPPPGLSRPDLLRWTIARFAAGTTAALLLGVAAAWILTARGERSVERERERRALELAQAAAAAALQVAPGAEAWTSPLAPDTARELRERLVTLRQVDGDVRSVFLLAPDRRADAWRVLIAPSGAAGGRVEGSAASGSDAATLHAATRGPTVADAPPISSASGSISAFAPVRDARGVTLALAGVDLDAQSLGVERAALRRDGALVALALGFGIVAFGAIRFRRRLAELERLRAMQAEISIHRVSETLARVEKDEDLVRCALDAIAEGSGIAHWALYLRDPAAGGLSLFATRALPEEARAELRPDAPARDARAPAARAAWLGDVVIARDPGAAPDLAFAANTPGLGARPAVVAVPLADGRDAMAVLECYVPRRHRFTADDLALIRWMATQTAVGLKRIRLERRDQMLASFSMGTGEILLGLDLAGAVTHANPAAEAALGAGPGGLVGRRLETLIAVEAGTPPGPGAGGGEEYSGEVWFLRPAGGRFPAEIRISPTRDRDGAPVAMVLVGHDVTDRKEREIEIANRTQQLALLNEQLQAANAELETARRMQSEFVANTSHELRTPLNAVIGFASLIEQGALESEAESRDFAGQIRRSAEHLLGLLNDILDLAKVEAGRFELSVSLGDLRGPVRAALEATSPLAHGKGLNLLVDLPMTPLLARLDAARVRQVMMNLLGNAVKFTDTGEVRVSAGRDERTGEARVVVEDTGIGIAPEKRALLFSKFTQLDGSYARRHGGTGLGLAISRALMQNMGGTIRVESDGIGRGTRATLVFPPASAEAARPRRPASAAPGAGLAGRA